MREKQKRGISRSCLWAAGFIFTILLFCAVLELGKHTLTGWVLFILLNAGYLFVRIRWVNRMKTGKRALSFLGYILLFTVILWISWPPEKRVPAFNGEISGTTDIVHLSQGDVTGVVSLDHSVELYAGIPYAKAPVGELRFREPEPSDGWEGVLQADHFAPMSMQTRSLPIYYSLAQIIGYHDYRISLKDNYREAVSEDSLYLNIWKPAGDVSKLPVLVYIHGGSLQTGQPWYQDYSGEGLAREGVVVVNFGYRLGIFGFFADEALSAESPNHTTGNYGLLDQIMALQWVQDNIASFGGDPDNVTLSGESAGSACVTALCTSPLVKGLFKRVAAESSTVTAPEPAHSFRLLDEALKAGEKTKKKLGAKTMEELRAIPAEKLAPYLSEHHHITVDGYVLTETPYESYKKGIHNEEAILQGFNREESAPFIMFSPASLKNYEEKVRKAFDAPYADRILSLYPAETDEEAKRNWADIYTAAIFTYGHYCWERQALSNDIPVYVYYFTKNNGRLGAWHSGEEVYLYGNIPGDSRLYDGTDRTLSETMLTYYKNYITSGDPNGEGLPVFHPGDGSFMVMEWGDTVGETTAPYLELYGIFDEIYRFGKQD